MRQRPHLLLAALLTIVAAISVPAAAEDVPPAPPPPVPLPLESTTSGTWSQSDPSVRAYVESDVAVDVFTDAYEVPLVAGQYLLARLHADVDAILAITDSRDRAAGNADFVHVGEDALFLFEAHQDCTAHSGCQAGQRAVMC
jgi:hypothetical protein